MLYSIDTFAEKLLSFWYSCYIVLMQLLYSIDTFAEKVPSFWYSCYIDWYIGGKVVLLRYSCYIVLIHSYQCYIKLYRFDTVLCSIDTAPITSNDIMTVSIQCATRYSFDIKTLYFHDTRARYEMISKLFSNYIWMLTGNTAPPLWLRANTSQLWAIAQWNQIAFEF